MKTNQSIKNNQSIKPINKLCQNNSIYNHITIDVSLDPDNPMHQMKDTEQMDYCETLWNHLRYGDLTLHYRRSKRSYYTLSVYSDETTVYQVFVLRYGDSNYTRVTVAPISSETLNDFLMCSDVSVKAMERKRNYVASDNRA